jgi:hypothetical protein
VTKEILITMGIRKGGGKRMSDFALKMTTAMFAKALDNFQHSTWFIPENQSFTLHANHGNLRTRIHMHCSSSSDNIRRFGPGLWNVV